MGDSCMCGGGCVVCVFIGDMDVSNVMCVVNLLCVSDGVGGVVAALCCSGVRGVVGLRLK